MVKIIREYTKVDNLIIIRLFICITFAAGVLLTGCVNTEGTIQIKGIVIDESTKAQIPWRDIIVQGLVERNKTLVPIHTGQFSCDSTGRFIYSLKKVKDAYYYNFCFVGDSDYAFITHMITLIGLQRNAKYLSFSLNKLVDFTIKIYRKSKTPVCDTLTLYWESDGVDGRILYPYKIDNYGKKDNYGLKSDLELRWIGGNIKSTIKTRAFADKKTTVTWRLERDGKRKEIVDTITCKRYLTNSVYLTY
jgi:hypothetical protein